MRRQMQIVVSIASLTLSILFSSAVRSDEPGGAGGVESIAVADPDPRYGERFPTWPRREAWPERQGPERQGQRLRHDGQPMPRNVPYGYVRPYGDASPRWFVRPYGYAWPERTPARGWSQPRWASRSGARHRSFDRPRTFDRYERSEQRLYRAQPWYRQPDGSFAAPRWGTQRVSTDEPAPPDTEN